MCEYDQQSVCQWVITLRCFGWKSSQDGEPEAVAFATETVPCTVCKPISDYTPEDIKAFSEALRSIRKWDKKLKEDVRKQLYPKQVIPGWCNNNLCCDS